MIIEFVDPKNAKPLILLHIIIGKDVSNHIKQMITNLQITYPEHTILAVPNGQPCPNNPLPKVAIANRDNQELYDALKAMFKGGIKPGEIKLLSAEQMKAITEAQANGDFKYIS